MLVEISNLTKRYDATLALHNLSLSIQSGKIIGLLGPNGSGKTTLIKVLLGLLRQYSGEAKILSKPIGDETKSLISYLPDKNHIPLHWNIHSACRFFADFFADFNTQKALKICDQLQLDHSKKLKHLSKGNKEKVSLMLMLARDAKLYVFDEPIAGVDPVARDLVFKLILEHYNKEASVIIATHLIYDVERILDEAIFLSQGQVLAHKSIADFTANGDNLETAFKRYFLAQSFHSPNPHNPQPLHNQPQSTLESTPQSALESTQLDSSKLDSAPIISPLNHINTSVQTNAISQAPHKE